jgi:hypothetical protein
MDHHCPWINNCVGLYTQKLFTLFNGYAMLTLSYAVGLVASQFIYDLFKPQKE